MARVTIEKCEEIVNGHFRLVGVAAERTRQIISGAPLTVHKKNDKFPVIALREIEAGNLQIDNIENMIIARMRLRGSTDYGHEADHVNEDLLPETVDYIPNEHDFDTTGDSEFDSGMFSDDIMEDDEDKLI